MKPYLTNLATAAATLAIIALSLIALAHGLERQADINQAVVAAHLEGNKGGPK